MAFVKKYSSFERGAWNNDYLILLFFFHYRMFLIILRPPSAERSF